MAAGTPGGRLMYAGAALEVVAAIVAALTSGSLKSAILKSHPHYTAAQLHTAEISRTAALIIGALIAIGPWIRMAQANGPGCPGRGSSRRCSSGSAP